MYWSERPDEAMLMPSSMRASMSDRAAVMGINKGREADQALKVTVGNVFADLPPTVRHDCFVRVGGKNWQAS